MSHFEYLRGKKLFWRPKNSQVWANKLGFSRKPSGRFQITLAHRLQQPLISKISSLEPNCQIFKGFMDQIVN